MAAILGVIELICVAVLPMGSAPAAVLSLILDVLILAVAFIVGRAAKRRGSSPVWNGALVGALFGALGNIGRFFAKVSAAQLETKFAGKSIPPSILNQAVAQQNSPIYHFVDVIAGLIVFGILGLILGAIGGASTKADTQQGE